MRSVKHYFLGLTPIALEFSIIETIREFNMAINNVRSAIASKKTWLDDLTPAKARRLTWSLPRALPDDNETVVMPYQAIRARKLHAYLLEIDGKLFWFKKRSANIDKDAKTVSASKWLLRANGLLK